MRKTDIIALIPARYGSTRFPGKALVPIQDRPMIQWVYERAKRSRLVDRVVVATDDERIRQTVSAFGGEAVMTSPSHANGTDRIAEVAKGLSCDIVVNVQGDEPLIRPEMIDQAIEPMVEDASIPMGTLCRKIDDPLEAFDPNVVKVVMDRKGHALYFSRAPIPWVRDEAHRVHARHRKHLGIYAYRREPLLEFPTLPPGACPMLLINQDGVEYKASKTTDSRKWTFNDIRALEIKSPTEISIITYEDQKRWAGKDRIFEFSLLEQKATPELSAFLLSRVKRPMKLAVLPEDSGKPEYEIPVKHLRGWGGSHPAGPSLHHCWFLEHQRGGHGKTDCLP